MDLLPTSLLLTTAAVTGIGHTAIGIDHTLPFIMLAKAQRWSLKRTWVITALCGVGHVLASVAIGALGIALGIGVERLEWLEASRGDVAAWGLVAFGAVYAAYSWWRSRRRKGHAHLHVHQDGTLHRHAHDHRSQDAEVMHFHTHEAETSREQRVTTFWALFVLFVLGPCEVLIPLLMFPAYALGGGATLSVVLVFGLCTIGTMLLLVTLGYLGMQWRGFERLEPHGHTLAGLAIAASGLGMHFLGV